MKEGKAKSKIVNRHRVAVEHESRIEYLLQLERVKWGSMARHIEISEEDPCLHPAIRGSGLMCTETKGREFSPTDGRVERSFGDILEEERCKQGGKGAGGGGFRDWWNVVLFIGRTGDGARRRS
jgi:hypothetical protein